VPNLFRRQVGNRNQVLQCQRRSFTKEAQAVGR
jgi:hypothetical protein